MGEAESSAGPSTPLDALGVLPGDGHLLARSGDALWERLFEWLPDVLGVPLTP